MNSDHNRTPIALWVYRRITGDAAASAARDISEEAVPFVPRNFLVQAVASSLTKIGDQCINPKVVLPWIFNAGGVPPALLGFLVPVREAFSMLPQLGAAAWLRTLSKRKTAWMLGCALQGIAAGVMGWGALRLSGVVLGGVLLGSLLVFSLSRAICSVTAKDLLGKTIPKGQRGMLNGLTATVSGVAAVTLGVMVMLGAFREGAAHWVPWLPVFGAGLWVVAGLVFGRLKEIGGGTDTGRHAVAATLRGWRLFRDDPMFLRFVSCRALLMSTALVSPYVSAMIYQQSGSSVGSLGALMILSGAAAAVSAPLWGALSDRSSRMAMVAGGMLAGLSGCAAYVLFGSTGQHSAWWGAGVYFLIQVGYHGVRLGRKTYIVDLPAAADRATYVAVANTTMGILLLIAGGIGAVVSTLGSVAALGTFSLVAMIGAAACLTLRNVEAPE